MAAFFRNTVQDPLDGNIRDTPPVIVVPREEDRPRWKQLRRSGGEARRRGSTRPAQCSDIEFKAWLDEDDRPKISLALERADELLALTVKDQPPCELRNQRRFPGARHAASASAKAIWPGSRRCRILRPESSIELPSLEYFEADRPFSVAAWFRVPEERSDRYVIAGQTDPQSRHRGWALEMNEGLPVAALDCAAEPQRLHSRRQRPSG